MISYAILQIHISTFTHGLVEVVVLCAVSATVVLNIDFCFARRPIRLATTLWET